MQYFLLFYVCIVGIYIPPLLKQYSLGIWTCRCGIRPEGAPLGGRPPQGEIGSTTGDGLFP